MDLKSLINFFPYSYKERDTYKVNNKGILERFLEICGTYLEDYITPDIDNALDLISIDNIPSMYLNYLWEYLGAIPFANGIWIDEDKFNKYYDGLKTKEELETLANVWTIQKSGPIVLTDEQIRNILRYAITLTKIRGTKKFFETLFHMYGIECTITDPIMDASDSDEWLNDKPEFDSDYYKFDVALADEDPRCSKCTTVTFNLDASGIFSDGSAIDTKNPTDVIQVASTQEEYEELNKVAIDVGAIPQKLSDFMTFRKMLEVFFERYLPYNVKALLKLKNRNVVDSISINLEQVGDYDELYPLTIITGKYPQVEVEVNISSIWSSTDLRYVVSSDGGTTWGYPHENGSTITFIQAGEYIIKPYSNTYKGEGKTITISSMQALNSYYKIEYSGDTEFGPGVDTVTVNVYGTYYEEVLVDGEIELQEYEDVPVVLLKGEYGTAAIEDITSGVQTQWTFNVMDSEDALGPQNLVFAIKEFPNKQIEVPLTRVPERAYGSITPVSIASADIGTTKLVFSIETNYTKDNDNDNLIVNYGPRRQGKPMKQTSWLGFRCIETGEVFTLEKEYYPVAYSDLHFEIVRTPDLCPTWMGKTDYFKVRGEQTIIENSTEYPTYITVAIESEEDTEEPTFSLVTDPLEFLVDESISIKPSFVDLAPTESSNIRVYKNGINTGTVINSRVLLNSTYLVNEVCILTFESVANTKVKSYTRVESYKTEVLSPNRVTFSPGQVVANWATNWDNITESTAPTAFEGILNFIPNYYINDQLITIEVLSLTDFDGNVIATMPVGQEFSTVIEPGIYYLQNSTGTMKANLLVATSAQSDL